MCVSVVGSIPCYYALYAGRRQVSWLYDVMKCKLYVTQGNNQCGLMALVISKKAETIYDLRNLI